MSGHRATTLNELNAVLSKMFTVQGVQNGLTFIPEASDVIISPFGKCGTTWMQQTVHGLRTRGSMDFGEISEVIPWIEAAKDMGQDLTASQVAQPRAFKSHLPWDKIPKGCRYICVLRDPLNALKSSYKFFEGWLMEPGAIAFEEFAYDQYLSRKPPKGYWHHLASWMEQRDNPDVLLLCYEHLQSGFPGKLKKIAEFIGVELDGELEKTVQQQSSLSFMREHGTHFDDHFLRLQRYQAMGLPEKSYSSKVSSTEAALQRPQPSQKLIADMQSRWEQEVTSRTGFKDYQALKQWFSERDQE